jgi:rod shape-determining protein MreD
MNNNFFGGFYYFVTVIVAMALKIMPLSSALQVWNPDWVLLILMYWVLAFPYKFGVFGSWTVGLFTDVLTDRILGQYALVYALMSYFCLKFYKRIRTFPLIQQGAFIFCCLLAAQILIFCIESIYNPARFQWSYLFPAISGTLVWPIAGVILRVINIHYRVG